MTNIKVVAVLLAVIASVSARRNLRAWVNDGNDFANSRCESSRFLDCNVSDSDLFS
jgi:hypothetical protein